MPLRHRLDAESLRVESFSADSGDGHAFIAPVTTLTYEGGNTCAPNRTCPDCNTQFAA